MKTSKPSSMGGVFFIGLALFVCLGFCFWSGFYLTPTDRHQGDVYRIIYLHVPVAISAFFSGLMLFIASIGSLRGLAPSAPSGSFAFWGRASAEVGLLLTVLTLATGSIWGRPTWGTWWTWDARLTTTLILAILYAGYLLLWANIEDKVARQKVCAVLGVMIFIDIPVIYKSVSWWRTLHQPPTLFSAEGSTMSAPMFWQLIASILVFLVISFWFIKQRAYNLSLREMIEVETYKQME